MYKRSERNRLRKRRAKSRGYRSIVTLLLITILSVTLITAMPQKEVETFNMVPSEEKTNISVTVDENFNDDISLNVKVMFYIQWSEHITSYRSDYRYEIHDKSGNIKDEGTKTFIEANYNAQEGGASFDMLPGDKLTVFDIPVEYESWTVMPTTAKLIIKPSNESIDVNCEPGETILLEEGKVGEFKLTQIEGSKLPTNDTFESIGGISSINYILKNYNVFSFNDVQGTHIMGPIIANNKAYRTNGYGIHDKTPLMVGDYTKGIPSFVRVLDSVVNEQNKISSTYLFNYFYDNKSQEGFKVPNLYVGLTPNYIKYNGQKYTAVTSDGISFIGPSNSGNSPVLQNDDFVNFELVRSSIINEGKELLNKPNNIEIAPDESTGYLKIELGKSYIIKDASRLRAIDIQYPEGYHPQTNPYPNPTFINIEGDTLPLSGAVFEKFVDIPINPPAVLPSINEEVHQYFPIFLVNGETFDDGDGSGEGVEYGEFNNIVINMPNISSRNGGYKMASHGNYDIMAHIVAPNAQFWSYGGYGGETKWNGGNINGCAIVDSWHGGEIEGHMWPFDVDDIEKEFSGELDLEAKKEFIDGTLKGNDFKFTLEFFDSTSIPEGVVVENIPQEVTNNENGVIKFSTIKFTKEGQYIFRIKEKISSDNDNIIYDKSEYKVVVDVSTNTSEEKLDVNYKVIKIKDSQGNELPGEEIANGITFINEDNTPRLANFIIKKIDEATSEILQGAHFDLYYANEQGEPKGEAIVADLVTDEKGVIEISGNQDIKFNTLYVLVETKAPEGYVKGLNKVFYIKGIDGLFPEIQEKIVIGDGGTVEITNKQYDYILPETGGKENNINLLGIIIMLFPTVVCIKRLMKI